MLSNSSLNLGAGMKHKPGFISVDLYTKEQEDLLLASNQSYINNDALDCLINLPSNSISNIYTRHFLEHLDFEGMTKLLQEIERVLVPGGSCEIIVPHWANPYFYSDPTHKTFFGLYTFDYLCLTPYFRRKTPRYAAKLNLIIDDVSLNFLGLRYLRPFYKMFSIILSSSIFLLEFHESSFARIIPPYEIRWLLVRPNMTTNV